jgi:hypothetical protein
VTRSGPVLAAVMLLTGCASTRVVPVPAAGVAVDPQTRTAATSGDGVEVTVRPSAWRGSPPSLPRYVTPFFVRIVNGSPQPIQYDYADPLLFDDARFQYTAMAPADVARLFRFAGRPGPVLAASAAVPVGSRPWRRPLFWDPWWDPWGPPWWGPAYAPPPVDDVFLQALPVGELQPRAQTHGFVYFPRLRTEARRLSFEFRYRQGGTSRVLTLPFAVERAAGDESPAVS